MAGDEVGSKKGDAYKQRRKHRAFTGAKLKVALSERQNKNMIYKYLFHNFTNKPFTGFWNGKAFTFKPGTKKYYPKGIAEHFAKHLTNQVLTESNRETFCSPKKPNEVPVFLGIFNKALIVEELPDADNLYILGNTTESEGPSMNIEKKPREVIDPYDASNQKSVEGPGDAPQIIGEAVDDEDYVEPKKNKL